MPEPEPEFLPTGKWSSTKWNDWAANGEVWDFPPSRIPNGRHVHALDRIREMPADSPFAKEWRALALKARNDAEDTASSPIGALGELWKIGTKDYLLTTKKDGGVHYTVGSLTETRASLGVMGLDPIVIDKKLHDARTHNILAGSFALCGYEKGIHTNHREDGDISIYNSRTSSFKTEPIPEGWGENAHVQTSPTTADQ